MIALKTITSHDMASGCIYQEDTLVKEIIRLYKLGLTADEIEKHLGETNNDN